MEALIPYKFPEEEKPDLKRKIVDYGLSLLCWFSPFIGFGIFFPLGVLMLYRTRHRVRSAAFQSLVVQIFIYICIYPLEILSLYSSAWMGVLNGLLFIFFPLIKWFNYLFIGFLFVFWDYYYWKKKYQKINPFYRFGYFNRNRISKFFYVFVALFFAALFSELKLARGDDTRIFFENQELFEPSRYLNFLSNFFRNLPEALAMLKLLGILGEGIEEFLGNSSARGVLQGVSFTMVLQDFLLGYWIFLLMILGMFRSRGVHSMLRRAYCILFWQHKILRPTKRSESHRFRQRHDSAHFRELILPGWGHIYLERYWIGYSLLFIYLLSLLFLMISLSFRLSDSFGVSFLASLGLKPGVPDKEFIPFIKHPLSLVATLTAFILCYISSKFLISHALRDDHEPREDRGLKPGFFNNLQISLLVHFILLTIILLVPISVDRSMRSQKKKQLSNYQPEKLEYYFIDPEIPDEVKDLNGGVISGTETPSQKDGIKIPDTTPQDEGKVKGYVKRIRGKKLPKTYSNYISARMRGPEGFMEYWKRAPYPYSSVVSYTITRDGDITDVEIVESSNYPDQDALTIELVKSMSPVMPPPNVSGDVRVTELFWNGPIDPAAMPSPLQKDLVLQFDGRYMEEF